MPIRPIGRLTRKMLRQPMKATNKPPRTGPAVEATAPAPVQIPITRARAPESLPQALLRSASEHGTSRAAPPPCTARAQISAAGVGARAQASEAAENTTKPDTNARRAPNRSLRTPADRSRIAYARK